MNPFRVACLLVLLALPFALWGCSQKAPFVAKYEPWRATSEQNCLSSGAVAQSPFLTARAALGGPSVCGAQRPFEMSGTSRSGIRLDPPAILRCNMVPAVERWLEGVAAPAAMRIYGVPLISVKVAASYSCRPMNNRPGAKLSEHGHANALDVSAFVLGDGRRVTVRQGWRGSASDQAFLREVHAGGCGVFSTVLGPEQDIHHRNHFHFDLARRGRDGTGRYCR